MVSKNGTQTFLTFPSFITVLSELQFYIVLNEDFENLLGLQNHRQKINRTLFT